MIVTLEKELPQDKLAVIAKLIGSHSEVRTQLGHYLVSIKDSDIDLRAIGCLSGVKDVARVLDKECRLVSREWRTTSPFHIAGTTSAITIIAGPCSIEDETQCLATAKHLQANNIKLMRAGVFKPRTSPYTFRGLGLDGLKMAKNIANDFGIGLVSEVLDVTQIEAMHDYVEIYQVGARNSQNFPLLAELGKIDKPVLIKRGISGTVQELLQSAEYVFAGGNEKVILCERGIRTFEPAYRNVLDINAIPYLKKRSYLPVFVDPSHATGLRELVPPVALAAAVAGADGIMYETHPSPTQSISDAAQALSFEESERLTEKLRQLTGHPFS